MIVLAEISEMHIILGLVIIFLLFGGKKLPELARGMGEAMKEFKKAQREINEEPKPVDQRPVAAPTTPVAHTTTTPADQHKAV